MTATPWNELSERLVERWKNQATVTFGATTAELKEELADWLAGHAGDEDLGAKLAEWLLEQSAVEDVFADDEQLQETVIEETRRVHLSSGRSPDAKS
jgi:hypothetical protein